MRVFEQLLGWSPDGGSGFLELVLFVIPVILLGRLMLRALRRTLFED